MLAERTTAASLWQAMSGRPLSADLLDWPPDLFALTSLMLRRSGAYRFALSPPPGRQWPQEPQSDPCLGTRPRTGRASACTWHKLPARRRGTEPRADHVNFLPLPWPLRIRASDFRPIEGSAQRDADEPYGFFDFDPAERIDLDLVNRMLVAARDEVDSIDVVCLPESAIMDEELAPLEASLESHGVTALFAGTPKAIAAR
jgi:hypothetical protein